MLIESSPNRNTNVARTFTDVVIVNDSAKINGGTSQVALSSALALAKSGCQVTVFAACGPAMPELGVARNLRLVLTGQHDVLSDPSRLRAATQGIWNVSAARLLDRTLRDLNPATTIVHFHGWTKALSSSVIRATTERGFRTVITLHDYFVACPIGSLYNHRRREICTIDPLSTTCMSENCDPRSYRDKMWRLARHAFQQYIAAVPREVRHFITLSDLSESVLKRALPARAGLHRVCNPIDTDLGPQVIVAKNSAFTFVGRLSPEKGGLLFAQAALDASVEAVFAGDGENAAAILEANPAARVTGWLDREGVRRQLSQSRVLVFPSLWHEVSPLVIFEAAALGVPAIVADTSAARERVVHGLSGLLFRGGDRASLKNALLQLTDGALAAVLGAEAFRSYWEQPQQMSQHIAELCDVYDKVIADVA